MRENRLRQLLNEGKPTFATRVHSTWPTMTELVGRSGQFDYVEFLAEYAPYSLHDLDNMGRAIELSPDFCGMIKVEQSAQWHLAVRAMAAGIQNVLFTDVRTAADAEQVVRHVRAEGPGNSNTHGLANGRIWLEAPADFIGRASDTYAGGIHPEVRAAREDTIKRCIAAGVRPRAEINRVEEVDYYTALGVKDFNLSSDLAILRAFYTQQGRALRERVAATAPAR